MIISNNIESAIKRNQKKSDVLDILISTKKINKIPYMI